MNFSKDELNPPAWIDGDYLQAVLQHDLQKKITITDYAISPAANAFDHFASLIFRVSVHYSDPESQQNEQTSLIIKTLPTEDGLKKDIVDSYDVFAYEGGFFSDVLPVCHNMLKSIGCQGMIGARMLYQSAEPSKNIVLQDLKVLRYEMSPTNYPPIVVYQAMFKKLALLHATTFKMYKDGNEIVSKFKGVLFNMSDIKDIYLFSHGKDLLSEVLKLIPGLETYSKKLQEIPNDKLIEKCLAVINEPGSYNVLNHGDLYIKNLMMKDTEEGKDVVFVDFQLCHWGSPAVDVAYIASFIPLQGRDNIIRNYFKTFIDTLKKLKYKGDMPTFEQFEIDLEKRRSVELFLLICSAPFMSIDSTYMGTENMDIDTFMADSKFIIESFKEARYVSLLKDILPLYLEQGYFEDLL